MSKHTPGPWTYDPKAVPCDVVFAGQGRDRFKIAEVYRSADTDAEDVCNGHLVAAAPDLLAACEALIRPFVQQWPNDGPPITHPSHDAFQAARAAIAKARGER